MPVYPEPSVYPEPLSFVDVVTAWDFSPAFPKFIENRGDVFIVLNVKPEFWDKQKGK